MYKKINVEKPLLIYNFNSELSVYQKINVVKPLFIYNFSNELSVYKKINGHETSWALGLALQLLA